MKRIFIFCFLLWVFPLAGISQSGDPFSDLVNAVKAPYSELDSTKISSGYLIDKAVDLVSIGLYDGHSLCDSNYVDVSVFCGLLRTMNYAKVNPLGVSYNTETVYNSLTSSNYVRLASAAFEYDRLRSDAITAGLIDYDSSVNKLSDKIENNIWQNPYEKDYAFVFTAGKQYVENSVITFDLSDLTAYGNCSICGVMIDFGDGEGYIEPNYILHQISYGTNNSPTVIELKLKITLQNNVVLESHSSFQIIAANESPLSFDSDADETFNVSSGAISAKCSALYSESTFIARKPIIYVEGFDHPVMCTLGKINSLGFTTVYNNILLGTCSDNYYFNRFYNYFRDLNIKGYDCFYVNWNNPEADIIQNAQLLKQVIRAVKNRMPADGSAEPIVIVAHSMGGLITRVALREMELAGENHKVGHFVSQDVPHLGAVVPIGLQYTLRDIYTFLSPLGIFKNIRIVATKIANVLDCTSARQMMYNYVNPYGLLISPSNSDHYQFQLYLNSIGFPKGDAGHPLESLAIVSGNNLPASELSESIFTFWLSLTMLEPLIMPTSYKNFTIYANINRDTQPNTIVSTTSIVYSTSNYCLPPQVFPFFVRVHSSPVTIQHMDGVAGSFLDFVGPAGFLYNNPILDIDVAQKIVFIPTASAIDYANYDAASYDNPNDFADNTPFDSYCFEVVAKAHDSSLKRYLPWITNHCKARMRIHSIVCAGDTLSITGRPHSIDHETLYSSNSAIATMLSDSIINVLQNGIVTFTYSAKRDSATGTDSAMVMYYRKNRTVFAGFPYMALEAQRMSGSQYQISALCITGGSSGQSLLDNLTASGEVVYLWGTKNALGNYDWASPTSNSTYSVTAPSGSKTYVGMKIRHIINSETYRESVVHVCTIDRTSTLALLHDPQEILVNHIGFSMPYQFVSDISSYKYFAVWCNPDYTGTVIAPDTVVIGNLSYPVATSFTQNVNGDSATVYCFDIKNDPTLLQTVSDVRDGTIPPQLHPGVPITIKGNNITIESLLLPVISAFPGPLTPIND